MSRCTVILGAGAVYQASGDVENTRCVNTASITKSLYTQYGLELEHPDCVALKKVLEYLGEGSNFEDAYEFLLDMRERIRNDPEDSDVDAKRVMDACGVNPHEIDKIINRLLSRVMLVIEPYDEQDPPRWFAGFFSKMESLNDSGVYLDFCVLNYDTWVERSLDDCETGFVRAKRYLGDPENSDIDDDYSVFRKDRAIIFGNRNTLCHPHGCVRYAGCMDDRDHGNAEICLWSKCMATAGLQIQVILPDGRVLSPIVTGKHKGRNFTFEPFATYMNNVRGPLASNDSILIVGYGFGDGHINEVIRKYGRGSGRNLVMVSPHSDHMRDVFERVCGYRVEQSEGIWRSDDGHALWYVGGFKESTSDQRFLEAMLGLIRTA